MKVLFVFGGIPLYVNALLNKLADKNVEIVAVVPSKSSRVLGEGVKVIENSKSSFKTIETFEKTSFLFKSYFPKLADILDEEKPDLLIAGWPYFIQFYWHFRLRKTISDNNIRFVMREIPFQVPPFGKISSYFKEKPMFNENMKLLSKGIAFYIRQWVTMHIRKFCYSNASGALAYSSVGNLIMPTYGIKDDRVFVTYNTNDTEALLREKEKLEKEPGILPENNRRIIHVGRLVKWKRVDLLIDAFSIVLKSFPNAELVVVGDGPEENHLKQQAKAIGIEKSIMFTGGLHDAAKLGAYLLSSSVYVLAGMGGLSINDAMTFGLPIICSVGDGTEKDLVEDNRNGFYFIENNASDLSEKLILLLKEPETASIMGKESLKIIMEKINIETVTNNYISSFKHILQ